MNWEVKQGKVVSRKGVVALGIVCIAFAAGLVSTIIMINDLKRQIAEKSDAFDSLNSQLTSIQRLVLTYAHYLNESNSEIAALNDQISFLKAQISVLNNYLMLNASEYLVYGQTLSLNASSYAVLWNSSLPYAGYVAAYIQSSSNTTYVQVVYSAFQVNFNSTITVGEYGVAAFPVLPAAVEVRIGNRDLAESVNVTVNLVYCY